MTKIIDLPADDPKGAKAIMKKWLTMNDKILFVVFGTTKIALETVRRADILSGGVEEEPHWVIHVPERNDIIDLLSNLEDPDELITDWDTPLAITLSISDVIRDMLPRNTGQPTYSRIDDAYRAAEIDGL